MEFKKSNLLILKGIFPADFTPGESVVVTKKAAHTEQSVKSEPTTVYSELPKCFRDVPSWPKSSNLKCWACDLLFTLYPKFVPMNPERDCDGNDICDALGNFCQWNCVVKYIRTVFPKDQQADMERLVCIFQEKFTGRRREKIPPSPDKTERKEYCGEKGLTVKQFRDKIEQLNSEYDLSTYKLDHFKNE
jgi:hypothetical protein